jgi:hypothetical protein
VYHTTTYTRRTCGARWDLVYYVKKWVSFGLNRNQSEGVGTQMLVTCPSIVVGMSRASVQVELVCCIFDFVLWQEYVAHNTTISSIKQSC